MHLLFLDCVNGQNCGCNCLGDMDTDNGTVTVVSGRCRRNRGRLGHHLNGGPIDWVRIGTLTHTVGLQSQWCHGGGVREIGSG